MTNYRRSDIAGASYFFTVNLADRSQSLLIDHIASLRSAFAYTRDRHPFVIDAIVVLPEHMHAIWTLPDGDSDFALRWRLIKTVFSRGLPLGEHCSSSRRSKAERGIWQRRYWEHLIRDEADFSRHVDYIHINPVCRRFAVPCVARLVRRLRNARYALRQSSPKSPDQPALLGGAQGEREVRKGRIKINGRYWETRTSANEADIAKNYAKPSPLALITMMPMTNRVYNRSLVFIAPSYLDGLFGESAA
ncbi:MAG: transposase [Nitrosomonadales bacterium]|nr:transposase [Nitrosomonadales bacterium]